MRFLTFLFSFFLSVSVLAAPGDSLVKSDIIEGEFEAEITVDDYVPAGKAVLFDASDSNILDEEEFGEARYFWDFHDGQREQRGKEQIYTFDSVGKKRVTLRIVQGGKEIMEEKEVFSYRQKAFLITDQADARFENIQSQAAESGTWLQLVPLEVDSTGFVTETKMIARIVEFSEFVAESDKLIFYTESGDSLAAFARYYQNISEEARFSLEGKAIVEISEGNFSVVSNIVNRSRKVLEVPSVLLTRPESLNPLFTVEEGMEIVDVLDARAIEYMAVDETLDKSGILVLSRLVSFFIESGIPSNTIYLLLAFPFIAFWVAFARQFIGFSTYGVFLPIMLTLSFFILGLSFALMVIAVVGIIGFLIRLLFNRVELLYIPKVALTLSMITLSFFVIIWFALYMELSLVIPMAVFPMLIISTLSERFISTQSQEGMFGAVIAMTETILVSLMAYLLTSWDLIEVWVLSIPEILILPFIGIVILGRFTGLRITEYFRFRSMMSEGMEEE